MELIWYFNVLVLFLVCLIWVGIIAFLRLKKQKNIVYLVFFTIFYVYVVKVLDYTLFEFQSLILLKHFIPDLLLKGQSVGKNINLFPLVTLTGEAVKTSLLNILLFIPFGFGLPFITDFRMKKVVVIGIFFSIAIELLQLLTGVLSKITFRIVDINDVIFNTVGAVAGYILFFGFVRMYRHLFYNAQKSTNPVVQYIALRPQVNKM